MINKEIYDPLPLEDISALTEGTRQCLYMSHRFILEGDVPQNWKISEQDLQVFRQWIDAVSSSTTNRLVVLELWKTEPGKDINQSIRDLPLSEKQKIRQVLEETPTAFNIFWR